MTYTPTLVNGLQPKYPAFDGQKWSAGMGSVWNVNMPHSVQFDTNKVRFELQNTPQDRGSGDPIHKRRSELANQRHARNKVEFWEAFTFIMQPWADRAGMKAKFGSTAASLHQMKWPTGNSPAYCLRVTGDAFLRVTTSKDGSANSKRYTGSKRMDDGLPHNVVIRSILRGDNAAELDVWVDGVQLLRQRGVPIGSLLKDGYRPSIGPYFAAGITCPIVVEYGNLVHLAIPNPTLMNARIATAPAW
jgi:hypothetical protein